MGNYENLPIKTFSGYKFLSEECRGRYEFSTFTDDDAFLDLNLLKVYLADKKPTDPFVGCLKGSWISNDRAPLDGKYYLWNELWSNLYKPPAYCNGQCSLVSPAAV